MTPDHWPPLETRAMAAQEQIAKWRSFFAGWLFGTRPLTDGPTRWARDEAESRLLLRVGVNALTTALVEKGILTSDEWNNAVIRAAVDLDRILEAKFPGFSTNADGLVMQLPAAADTMKREGFPP